MRKVFIVILCAIAVSFGSCDKEDNRREPQSVNHSRAYTFQTEELPSVRDGLNIYGVAYIPEGPYEKWPLVIYSHGIGSSHAAGEPYAEALAQKGYVVYCFDFCGSSKRSLSDGDTDEMTIFTEHQDLCAVIQNLQEQPYIDARRTYLLGISLGGLVSAMAADTVPDKIRNMVLVYPAFCAPDDARRYYDADGNLIETDKRQMMGSEHYNKSMLKYDPYEHMSNFFNNILIIHGTEDRLVPIEYSERAETVYPNARLIRIEGAGHGFKGEVLQQAIQITAAQLDEWESTQN